MALLEGRIALVTGASRGIGYATALALARQGAHVIAVARTSGGLEELDDAIQTAGGSATLVPMDLTDMPAIDRLGAAINDRWGKLDILVANAGVLGVISPVGHVEAKVFDKVMTVNVTATWRVVETLARVWAAETEKTSLKVNSIDPGATRTAMRAQAFPGEKPETLPQPAEVAAKLVPLCGPDCTVTGKLFRVAENRFFDYRLPE